MFCGGEKTRCNWRIIGAVIRKIISKGGVGKSTATDKVEMATNNFNGEKTRTDSDKVTPQPIPIFF